MAKRRITKAYAESVIKRERYKERVKKMRPYLSGLEAADGFDLRDVDNWTAAQRRRVTRSWEVLAPQVSRPHIAKYYRRRDHLESAIEYAQQDRLLPGQKAALIPAESPKAVKIDFAPDGSIKVKRHGVTEDKVRFDPRRFIADPYEELEKALEQTSAEVFKIMTGPHVTKGTFTREELPDILSRMLSLYDSDTYDDSDRRSKYYGNWLRGIIGFKTKSAARAFAATAGYTKKAAAQRVERIRGERAAKYKLTKRMLMKGRR